MAVYFWTVYSRGGPACFKLGAQHKKLQPSADARIAFNLVNCRLEVSWTFGPRLEASRATLRERCAASEPVTSDPHLDELVGLIDPNEPEVVQCLRRVGCHGRRLWAARVYAAKTQSRVINRSGNRIRS